MKNSFEDVTATLSSAFSPRVWLFRVPLVLLHLLPGVYVYVSFGFFPVGLHGGYQLIKAIGYAEKDVVLLYGTARGPAAEVSHHV